jgi:hypothetical protein
VVLRREPGFVTEEWWRGRAGVGDHGGRANLAGGCLGWPIHDTVAGARDGEVAGEAAKRNRRQGWVHCVRLELSRGRRARLTEVGAGRGGAGSIELEEGGRGWSRLV